MMTMWPLPTLFHGRQGCPDCVCRAKDVRLDQTSPILGVTFGHRPNDDYPGVGYREVETVVGSNASLERA